MKPDEPLALRLIGVALAALLGVGLVATAPPALVRAANNWDGYYSLTKVSGGCTGTVGGYDPFASMLTTPTSLQVTNNVLYPFGPIDAAGQVHYSTSLSEGGGNTTVTATVTVSFSFTTTPDGKAQVTEAMGVSAPPVECTAKFVGPRTTTVPPLAPASTPATVTTLTPQPVITPPPPFVPAPPPAVPPALGPAPTCRPSAANEGALLVCVPPDFLTTSTGETTLECSSHVTQPPPGNLTLGCGIMTGGNSSVTLHDPYANTAISAGPNSRIDSYSYPVLNSDGEFSCTYDPVNCLAAGGFHVARTVAAALLGTMTGGSAFGLAILENGIYNAADDVLGGVGTAGSCLGKPYVVLVCHKHGSDAEVTVTDGQTDVQVLSGSWFVVNLASGELATLTAGQKAQISNNNATAASQNLAGSVASFDPSATNQWWAASAAGGAGSLGIPPVAFALVTLLLLLLLAAVAVVFWQRRRHSRLIAVPIAPPFEEGQSGDGVAAAGPPVGTGPPPPYYYAPPGYAPAPPGYAPAPPGYVPVPGYGPYPWPAPPKLRRFRKTLLVIRLFAVIVVFVGTFWLVSGNFKPSTVSSLSNPTAPGATASAALLPTLAPFDVGNPTGNDTAIAQTIGKACTSTSTLAACEAASLTGLNQARTQEGLAPLSLPAGFWNLGYDEQLLFLLNAERTSRNLAPFGAVYPSLNADALAAAQAKKAPSLAAQGSVSGFGGWSGGEISDLANTIWIVFTWDYYDGPGSGEAHCAAADASGCWAMREAVLRDFESTATSTLALGAACVSTTNSYSVGKRSLACAWEGGPAEALPPPTQEARATTAAYTAAPKPTAKAGSTTIPTTAVPGFTSTPATTAAPVAVSMVPASGQYLLCGARVPNQYSPVGYIAQGFVAHFVVTGPVGTTIYETSIGKVSVPDWTGLNGPFPVRAASDPPSSPLVVTYDMGLQPDFTVQFMLDVNGSVHVDNFSFHVVC